MSFSYFFNKIFFYIINSRFYLLINLRLLIKLGVRPFHSWFISILKTRSLNILFILSTFQKVIPLLILFNIKINNYLLFLNIFITIIFLIILLPRTIYINKVLAMSSINNIIWLILSILYSIKIIFIFMIIYMFLLGGFINVFNFQGLKIFNQINSIMFFEKFSIIMLFISLGGMPPLLGFLRKMIILKIILINFFNMVFILIVIFSSLILLYFYLSRIYFFLRNIPSLKINFNINLFSIKKIIYIISLTYINIILILQI